MIYITHYYSDDFRHINNVFDVENDNVKEAYSQYLESYALFLGIVINPHWYNIMDWEKFHPELTKQQYKAKEKLWKKYLKTNNIDWFIENVLNGKKLNYKEL